jgi:hypothetical protein
MSDNKVVEEVIEQSGAVSAALKYSLKDAEPVAGHMILKVTNFDQPSTRYYYTPYPVGTSVSVYGEVIAADQNNEYALKSGDRVLCNVPIVYQSLEDGDKYVVVPINGIILIWRSQPA